MELYRKYRPTKFNQIRGQDEAIGIIKDYLNRHALPHALLLTGASGCGKTTITRILAAKSGCATIDYREINAAGKGGIDVVRGIQGRIGAVPSSGRVKFYVIDEAHELTRPAQEHLLKTAEECPKHAYIVLCTTDPKDLIRTIMTRFTEIKISVLDQDSLTNLVIEIGEKEGKEINKEVAERIAEVSDGSARMALNILGKVISITDPDKQLDIIQKTEAKRGAWDLAMMLMGWGQRGKKTTWQDVKKLLEELKGQEEPEKIRRIILGCLATECLKGGKIAQRAAVMFEAFRDDYYATGYSGLVFSCFACCSGS